MTITQTVEIPENRRVTLDIPSNCPTGRASVIIQFPAQNTVELTDASTEEVMTAGDEILHKHLAAFEALAK